MMTLNAYLARRGAKKLSELAADIGVSRSRLSQLRNSRDWPPTLALKIEAATGGEISASELSPVVLEARTQAA